MDASVTREFAVDAPTLVKPAVMRLGRRYWWCPALPLAACLVMALTRYEWLLVALMIIFLALPTAITFAILNHGLKPQCVFQKIPHTVTFTPRGIDVGTGKHFDWPQVDTVALNGDMYRIALRDSDWQHIYIPAQALEDITGQVAALLVKNGITIAQG